MNPCSSKFFVFAVAALLAAIALVLLLHVYWKWWFLRNSSQRILPSLTSELPNFSLSISLEDVDVDTSFGLDASAVASLPIFVYKSDEHKSAVQCVICLCTLVDDEKGRVLPKCRHVFHVGCIDMWLHSHSTCPICRADVVGPGDAVDVSVAGEEEVSRDPPETSSHEQRAVAMDENSQIVVEVELPPGSNLESQMQKDSSASSSSAFSGSLKRMLSWNRSESKVFPSNASES